MLNVMHVAFDVSLDCPLLGLHKAMTKREIEELERAMTFVRKNGFEPDLAKEMMKAGKLLGKLKR